MHCSIFIRISGLNTFLLTHRDFLFFFSSLVSFSVGNECSLTTSTQQPRITRCHWHCKWIASSMCASINIGMHLFDYLINFNLFWMWNELLWKKWHRFPCRFLDVWTNKQTKSDKIFVHPYFPSIHKTFLCVTNFEFVVRFSLEFHVRNL